MIRVSPFRYVRMFTCAHCGEQNFKDDPEMTRKMQELDLAGRRRRGPGRPRKEEIEGKQGPLEEYWEVGAFQQQSQSRTGIEI